MKSIIEIIEKVQLALSPEEEANIKREMEEQINWLINNDFSQLVQILYRLDVDEEKLRSLLHQKQTNDASTLIVNLIIERQLKKAEVRKQMKNNIDISGNEPW